jgi:DNA-binding FadR family transcriptional regulator
MAEQVSAPVWRPVRGGNAFEITVARLVQAIKLGMVADGDRLPPERELAERLNVSRVTLREAIGALRDAGYLESRRGRSGGNFVVYGSRALAGAGAGSAGSAGGRTLAGAGSASSAGGRALAGAGSASSAGDDPAELAREMGPALDDALDFRRVLEPGAAALAATRTLSAPDRQALVGALAATRERGPTRRVNDSRLHLAIAAASGSPSLHGCVADVQLTLDRLLAAIPVIPRNLDHSDAQHDRIVDAILHGDSAAARAAMEEHCDGTAELLRGLLG